MSHSFAVLTHLTTLCRHGLFLALGYACLQSAVFQAKNVPHNFVKNDVLGLELKGKEALAHRKATAKFALRCHKEIVEAALLSQNIASFQYPDLKTIFQLLNAKEEESRWKQVCSPIVPIVLFPERIFKMGDVLEAKVKIANRGAQVPKGALHMEAECGGIYISEVQKLTNGTPGEDFLFSFPADDGALIPPDGKPCKGHLTASIRDDSGGELGRNHWEFWLYPTYLDEELDKALEGIHLTTALDETAHSALNAGKSVLLLNDRSQKNIPQRGFLAKRIPGIAVKTREQLVPLAQINSIFCNPAHPFFVHFPTEEYADWQWWYLVKGSDNYVLDEFSKNYTPIVQVLDDSHPCQKLGMIFEGRAGQDGRGKFLVCAVDKEILFHRPEGRQLLVCMANYMKSHAFKPLEEIKLK
jgi:hypothetical protein